MVAAFQTPAYAVRKIDARAGGKKSRDHHQVAVPFMVAASAEFATHTSSPDDVALAVRKMGEPAKRGCRTG
jgi:hypothetical protein